MTSDLTETARWLLESSAYGGIVIGPEKGKAMPRLRWYLLGAVLCCTGCGALLTQAGTNVSNIPTRDMVHQEFGKPSAAGVEDGHPYEDFVTYRKIAEPEAGEGLVILDLSTAFLAEAVLFPMELYLMTDHAIEGQKLHFTYDEKGNVVDIHRDGKPAYKPPFNALTQPVDYQPTGEMPVGTNANQMPK